MAENELKCVACGTSFRSRRPAKFCSAPCYQGQRRGKSIVRVKLVKDMVGQRFGRLLVKERSDSRDRPIRWSCVCDCGQITTVRGDVLRRGKTRSCGCLGTEVRRAVAAVTGRMHRTHGESVTTSHTVEYQTWCSMLRRCYTPSATSYPRYGAIGVTVCDRWRSSYEAFLQDMGRRPGPEYSIDRIDTTGDYETGNCRWATRSQQMKNRRPKTAKQHRAKVGGT